MIYIHLEMDDFLQSFYDVHHVDEGFQELVNNLISSSVLTVEDVANRTEDEILAFIDDVRIEAGEKKSPVRNSWNVILMMEHISGVTLIFLMMINLPIIINILMRI